MGDSYGKGYGRGNCVIEGQRRKGKVQREASRTGGRIGQWDLLGKMSGRLSSSIHSTLGEIHSSMTCTHVQQLMLPWKYKPTYLKQWFLLGSKEAQKLLVLMLRGLALAGTVVMCIYKGPHLQQHPSTPGTGMSQGSQVHTCLQRVMFTANNFVAHLKQPLPTVLHTVCWGESSQHTHFIHISNGRL